MNRPLRLIWTLVLAVFALPVKAADYNIKVKGIVGPEVPRLGFTLVPGAEIGAVRNALNPVPLISPMAELGAIPSVPQMAELQSPMFTPTLGIGNADVAAGITRQADIKATLGERMDGIATIAAADTTGLGSNLEFGKIYSGQRGGREGGAYVSVPKQADTGPLTKNADGVYVMGRAAEHEKEARRIVNKRQGQIDYSEATDVMDDAYAEAFARAKILEHESTKGEAGSHSSHLPMTLTWVDGVVDQGDKKVAVHTSRVFFHHAKNPQSEIAEGLRRVEHTIKDAVWQFREGGRAEAKLGQLDEVVLGFDTRGYKEIKDYIKGQEADLKKQYGDRFRFVYLDEITKVPQTITDMRNALNQLIMDHKDDETLNVIEGVIYSRYVGMLLELKTAEYYYDKGYKILQGGRELFDDKGHYITELDVVVRSPQGVTYLVEAKSARVPLTQKDVMDGKILYKLDTYKRNKARLEQADILGGPLNVVFSVDVGVPPADVPVDNREDYVKKQRLLMTFLSSQEKDLSAKYGFPVKFLFLYSVPGHDPVTPDNIAPPAPGQAPTTGRTPRDRGRRRHGRR